MRGDSFLLGWRGYRSSVTKPSLFLITGCFLMTIPVVADGTCGFPPYPATFVETFGDLKNASWPICQAGDPPPSCTCTGLFDPLHCGTPVISRGYELVDPMCDPTSTSCAVAVTIDVTQPGIEDSEVSWDPDPSPTPLVYWWDDRTLAPNCFWQTCISQFYNPKPDFTCGFSGSGGRIRSDTYQVKRTFGGVTCGNAVSTLEAARLYTCPTSGTCNGNTFPINGIGGSGMAASIGCPVTPPMEDGDCRETTGGDGSVRVGGGGSGKSVTGSGPGATLSFHANGAGGVAMPGTAAWRTTLGRHWSHDYAERIVEDPDETRVWLITKKATFREFSSPDGSGVYQTVAPGDEKRTLTWLGVGLGWELESLDGTLQTFDSNGLWLETQDPNGNLTTATYVSGELTTVTFADGRSETFNYHASGKLASITENGVGGGTRTWTYTWLGHDLTDIGRPDGTALQFRYSPMFPGYMIREYLIGTDGSVRVRGAWWYASTNPNGDVFRSWRGAESWGDAGAVDKYELSYDTPGAPTQTTVLGPTGTNTIYTIDRSEAKPRVTARSGSCPLCGTGPDTNFTYGDAANPHSPTSMTDANGNITTIAYNTSGAPTQRIEAPGQPEEQVTDWEYNDSNFPAKPTKELLESVGGSPQGRFTTFVYDSDGNVTTRTIDGVENGSAFTHSTVTAYNSAGQPTSINPPGTFSPSDETTFTYDPTRGNLLPLTRTDPIGTTTFEYDAFNRRTAVIDANGLRTETTYDDLDRVTSVTQKGATAPEDLVTTYEYNVFGDLFRVILPEGNLLEYGYDSAGRLTSVERKPDAATKAERTIYILDGAGNRTNEKLQAWETGAWVTKSETDFQYSSECRLNKTIRDPNGVPATTEYDYDCNGNLTKIWDANHDSAGKTNPASTEYAYDALDRIETVSQPWTGTGGGNAVTTYGYDVQDHLVSVTDAEGNQTQYEYSDRDLLTKETSPVSGMTTHAYNEHGELTSTTDARGVTVTRAVDGADRITAVTYPASPTLDTTYSYGSTPAQFDVGRLTAITRNSQSISYTYDRFGRTLQDGDLTYAYDKNGNRTGVTYPGSILATYTHDFADRQVSLTVDDGSGPLLIASNATYLPSGPLTALDLANGLNETRTFDGRYFPDLIQAGVDFSWDAANDHVGNITSISSGRCSNLFIENTTYAAGTTEEACRTISTGAAVVVDTASEVRFEAGERISIANDFSVTNGSTFTAAIVPAMSTMETYTYAYQDYQYFLTQGDGPWGTRAWTYDKIGNRLTEDQSGTVDTYSYTSNGSGNTPLLASISLGTGGTRNFTYGPAGHMTQVDSGGAIDLTIDEASRMSGIDSSGGTESVDMLYDGRSFLTSIEKAISGPDLATTKPTYSSEGLLRCLERQENSLATPENTYYFYLAGRPVAQLLADGVTSTWTYLTTDHLGTPILASDSLGETVWQGPLEPFGRDWLAGTGSGATENGMFLRFPGQWDDGRWEDAASAAAMNYNVHRWYGYPTGRYGRPDPLGVAAGPALYPYAASAPTRLIDPLGLAVELYCHEVGAGGGSAHQVAGALGYKHCFVRVTCDCVEEGGPFDLRLEVRGRDNGLGEIPSAPPQFAEGHNAERVPISPADSDGSDCATERCILQLYYDIREEGFEYPITGFRYGPNSNTFTDDLLRGCGTTNIDWPDGVTPFNPPGGERIPRIVP